MSIEVNEVPEVTEATAAQDLAKTILGGISSINDQLVSEQYRLSANMNAINDLLSEVDIDVAYILSLLKAVNIITANILATPDMPDGDRVAAIAGMQVSTAVLLREKLVNVPDDQVVTVIAALTNLLTILDVPDDSTVDQETLL